MKGILLAIGTLLLGFMRIAQAYVSDPTYYPSNPTSADTIEVRLTSGYCDIFPEDPNAQAITRNGNAITIVLESLHADDAACTFEAENNYRFPIGSLIPGMYTLTVQRKYRDFLSFDVVETLGELELNVSPSAAALAAVPAIDGLAMVVLFASLLVLASRFRPRSVSPLLVLAMLVNTSQSQAGHDKLLQILIASEPGAPTAESVIDWLAKGRVGAPPLTGLSVENPEVGFFLLPLRATGDFLEYLEKNPETARAELERYIVVRYPSAANLANAENALAADAHVLAVSVPLEGLETDAEVPGHQIVLSGQNSGDQYGWEDLNVAAAWLLGGGYALVGSVDSGLATNHPALRQFDAAGHFIGGNFVPASSLDVGLWPGGWDWNVDEGQRVATLAACSPDADGYKEPVWAGHGTHTAGLIAANSALGLGVKGVCKNCGIAEFKVARNGCDVATGRMYTAINDAAGPAAITMLTDSGAQVINTSFGFVPSKADTCSYYPGIPICKALAHAASRGITMIAASGNNRVNLQFPAHDQRVVAVGGFNENLALWDESPGSDADCPKDQNLQAGHECGSNYSLNSAAGRQELVASAKDVLSIFYPNKEWNRLGCGDSVDGINGDGQGLCTGTSMSAPQVAGLFGILHSINPLVPNGTPSPEVGEVFGLRAVVARTTVQAQANQGWTPTIGYGRPDAAAAAKRVLGNVEGRTVKNRATPVFRVYSVAAKDYADTTSPQFATALIINQAASYQPSGAAVPGYAIFPNEASAAPLPTPKAKIYVLTTEYAPRPEWPALTPLYMVERTRAFPSGCMAGSAGCNPENRDFTLLTSPHIDQSHADGYSLRTIQGYIYQTCTPEPGCIPPGAQKLYRACKLADDDCAIFLEHERVSFETAGYVTAYPPGSGKVLGYAYPANDLDGDGLVDGLEYAIGTKVNISDSDSDGTSDSAEFPIAGIAISDPCSGAIGGSCPSDVIFANGFL